MNPHAIVIGAGLAGSSAAERLAARGWKIDLIERAHEPGQGASGNVAGVLRPLPSLDDNRLARLTRAGFEHACRHFAALTAAGQPLRWGQTGVLHLARDETHAATQRRVVEIRKAAADELYFVDRQQARKLAAWPVASGGWWFPGGGWVDPASLCRANVARYANAISAHYDTEVAHIDRPAGLWRARNAAGEVIAAAPVLILANATTARYFSVTAHLPLRAARGQVSHLRARPGSAPDVVVCRLGYVTPAIDGLRCAGATFSVDDGEAALREADHAENLAKLDFILPGYGKGIEARDLAGRVGFRPLSPDRLPMIGAVGDAAAIDPGAPSRPLAEMPRLPGLYLINGFGARGIVWSALAGELLACLITAAPLPLPDDLVNAVDPGRFLLRGRSRRQRTDSQPSRPGAR
ncbi:MAG: tRNA 5-methylaminomethyl-2-thiouridine biosynthesis bifunctional protein MnmC [Candidatus Accumulibacter regalis]|jgi:tRNA 5-methylaminomethyl-2-thiouridine biosynthesis bifunctional protein|uniref:tRNA 5-methylaminomethyl-2-thiouridine biosynthesis bifunctional protein MnmC n=1 Tax=Accumulibacter regalis TaxID=522306 RepID=A0A011P7H5_ACCRE|nr:MULTISPECIES: FAD-dependent 5-carboxymethylaminomethyl-2-thiouridine(34) oxidoreductase MnmC [unclassified Candidatus Accumulibacter]EXI90923.1 MAG: tRNA 5-methylaminomethyl-2-thiouridine biosynthesis bifunctional protein MnmC [Candidatus Accumulibacter regalis]MBL8367904.1 FAD-dependent 5-carboxymethylaminomethyl-2-thiouridine(34) oxidoreductase MnmC [Accumulibacter sp.]MBN8513831.1 FAD-dependent 5-carboxymethylaminomethyl-2-thiouridine(34) oxidoreductase MnmC [Accumulibacter sp.]HRE69532.1